MRLSLVLLGGALGSAGRYLVSVWMAGRFGDDFPWGTLVVNVVGSFLIGLLATLADEAAWFGPEVRVFLVAGLLGGFTTFSAFSLETLRLVEDREIVRAAFYMVGSVVLSITAALLGVAAGRTLDG